MKTASSNRDLTRSIILSVSTNILRDISYYETILMLETQEIRITNDILQQSININCTLLIDNISIDNNTERIIDRVKSL